MLVELAIENIALIERLRIELNAGFNVLTGETGAGKSIVVDSLSLALGGRADREMIRTGAQRARVEALFDVSGSPEAVELLEGMGIEIEDSLVAVARELTVSGRNVCRIGGAVMPLNELKKLTALLVDLHGQHEHQQLGDKNRHLKFLDAYGDAAHAARLHAAREAHAAWSALKKEAMALQMDAAERERRRDMLSFQVGEIDAVKPKPGEEDALRQKNELALSAERVAAGLEKALELTYRGGRSRSAQESLKRAAEALEPIAGLDARFGALMERLSALYYEAEDVGYELAALMEGLTFDPAEAEKTAERLSELKRLTKKYGPEISDVIAFRDQAAAELETLEHGEERLKEIERALHDARAALVAAFAALTKSRKAVAAALSEKVMDQLGELGMARSRFEVRFGAAAGEAQWSARGADEVEFLLSANPGEPLKPLAAVASGGELSRIMLAMKVVAADTTGVNAMVFDEIDTGISGRMAQVVGEKMAAIARTRQVICVTHLPQIAALADWQYLVEKTTDGLTTGSTVMLLDRKGRVDALARMIGGAGDAESGKAHAEHLLSAAAALKHPQA